MPLAGLGVLSARGARWICAAAVLIAIVGALYGRSVGSHLSPVGLEDPHSETAQANALIVRATGNEALPGFVALVSLGHGVTHTGDGRQALLESLATGLKVHRVVEVLQSDPQVGKVQSALDAGSYFISRNRLLSYVTVQFREGSERFHVEAARRLAAKLSSMPGVKVGGSDLASSQVTKVIQRDTTFALLIVFPILALLSLLFFRGLVAAPLPVLLGGIAIILTRAGLRIVAHFLAVSAPVLSEIMAIGLGLAIDYSLLIVSRFREELALNDSVPEAVRTTMATAGRTVLFSASTVIAALGSLMVLPQEYFRSMGLAGAMVTLFVCLAALTILPALLILIGKRIDALSPRWLQRSARRVARPVYAGRWYRLATVIMRRPVMIAVAATCVLVALGLPALGMKFSPPDVLSLPPGSEIRQVASILDARFKLDPEHMIPIVTVGASQHELKSYQHQLANLPGISTIALPEQPLGNHTALVFVASTAASWTDGAQRLVDRIRTLRPSFEAKVTGPSAAFLDLETELEHELPLAAILVALATLLSVFLLTGSIVLPVKTLIMNALSGCATLGILVIVFQNGFLHGLLGNAYPGTLEIANPVFLIAVLFGLSTDYGVFLLARIREVRLSGQSNEKAIALGMERTGRITTTAALMLCVAVGSLMTSGIVDVRQLSLGLAIGVLLDATVVRALLVPSLMRLLGELNWWSPAVLRPLTRRRRYESATNDTDRK
jgi:RND superfamily putative drug exporter